MKTRAAAKTCLPGAMCLKASVLAWLAMAQMGMPVLAQTLTWNSGAGNLQ